MREGNERLLAGDAGSALLRYEAAERAVGPHPELDLDRGNALYRAGRVEEARAAWARAAAKAPAPLASRAEQNLGTALAAGGDRDGAITALSEALRLDPDNEDARVNLEILLRQRQRQAERDRERAGQQGAKRPGQPGAAERPGAADPADPAQGAGRKDPRRSPEAGAQREPPASGGVEQRADAAPKGEPQARAERAEAERLLDALRARERPMPLPGSPGDQARPQGGADADRDW